MTRCNYWDCGWCYAPEEVETNAKNSSACESSYNCPYLMSIMNKPEFPKARLISEDFLPKKSIDDLATNYRIRDRGSDRFYCPYVIEKKTWFGWKEVHLPKSYACFETLEQANCALYRHLSPPDNLEKIYYPDFTNCKNKNESRN